MICLLSLSHGFWLSARFIPRLKLLGEVWGGMGYFLLYGVLAAVLIHAVGNAFGHPLAAEYIQTIAGMEFLASISNGLILIAFACFLGTAIHRWRAARVSISG
jgi:hypothetical protein